MSAPTPLEIALKQQELRLREDFERAYARQARNLKFRNRMDLIDRGPNHEEFAWMKQVINLTYGLLVSNNPDDLPQNEYVGSLDKLLFKA